MDYEKLRYDLAMQLASIRLLALKLQGNTIKDENQELLEIFSACYEKYQKISNAELKALTQLP